MQMGQPSGISGVAAQADRLSSDDAVTNANERTALGEVGVSGDGAIRMANLHPVGLAFSRLTVAKLHAYLRHHAGPCRAHRCPDGHDEVIGILVGTLVTTI